MKSIIAFMQGLRKLPTSAQLWLMILGMSNMMAPLFFIAQREAYVMFIATMLSFAVGVVLYKIQGMTRLMGVMHAPWFVSVYFLVISLTTVSMDSAFGVWIRAALVLTSISLLLDIKDVVKYMLDKRSGGSG